MRLNKKSVLLFLVFVLAVVMVSGCGNSAKDKFVGRWTGAVPGIPDMKRHIEISSKDGKTFGIVFVDDNGKARSREEMAVLKDDYLEVNSLERLVIGPNGTINFRSGTFTKDVAENH